MTGGTLDITAVSDGIDVEKESGAVEISGGTVKIAVSGDGGKGIKSAGNINITGGSFDIATTGNAYYDSGDSDKRTAL